MEVEQELEQAVGLLSPRDLFAGEFVCGIHKLLHGKLPSGDRHTDDGKPIAPGKYRQLEVTVGRHLAPAAKDIGSFLEAWADRYKNLAGTESLVIASACSHHRLAWVHPFIDGNGRVARLHSHLLFHSMELVGGLWSPMRGLARTREQYYARLHNADLPRRNDLDGRGSLSQEELVAFAGYFLDECLDQIRSMREQLKLETLKERLSTLLHHLQRSPWQIGSETSVVKIEALEAFHYVAMAGPIERARFIAMTGLATRTGRRVLTSLLEYGVLTADSSRGPVAFALPMSSLQYLFPNLWPEAATD